MKCTCVMDRNADVALTKNAGQGAEGAEAGVVESVYHHKSTVGANSQPKRGPIMLLNCLVVVDF